MLITSFPTLVLCLGVDPAGVPLLHDVAPGFVSAGVIGLLMSLLRLCAPPFYVAVTSIHNSIKFAVLIKSYSHISLRMLDLLLVFIPLGDLPVSSDKAGLRVVRADRASRCNSSNRKMLSKKRTFKTFKISPQFSINKTKYLRLRRYDD